MGAGRCPGRRQRREELLVCRLDHRLVGSELAPRHDGLALIAASSCPHYDGEPQRRPAYRVERRDREAHEERLEARYLGG